jgi:protein-L-isoaspartate O-methyltransferase
VTSSAYQSFSGTKGDSQSNEKLAKIGLAIDLSGKSVLDLGCNEGFFSIEAKRRHAQRVVGLDHNARLIELAKVRAAEAGLEVDFLNRDVFDLPPEQFDVVIFLSALHYIEEPARLLQVVRGVLKPDGVLILEIGVSQVPERRSIQRALRSIDERLFPSPDLLNHVWLRGYAVRQHGRSVSQVGDPVPRFVFHCQPAKTSVIFILGKGGIGKSNLASNMGTAPVISTDQLFAPVRYERAKSVPQQKLYDDAFSTTGSIWATWAQIKEEPSVRDYFADVISRAIRHCTGEGQVIVEGYVAADLVEDVKEKLGADYNIWRTDMVA